MRVLAFDPGKTCGISLVDHNGDAIIYVSEDIDKIRDWVVLAGQYYPDQIAMEVPPWNTKSRDIYWHVVEEEILCNFATLPVVRVSPGEWKPLKRLLGKKNDEFYSDHEKDATYIARYVQRKLRK